MTPPTPQNQSKLKQGVIRLNIEDLKDLYQAYMPFVDGCGIFVATEEKYALEQEVFVFLKLPGDLGKFAASGRIVWLNPPKKISKRVPGVGVQQRSTENPRSHRSRTRQNARQRPAIRNYVKNKNKNEKGRLARRAEPPVSFMADGFCRDAGHFFKSHTKPHF